MKFKIKKHTEIISTNIFGKPVETREFYTIDRVILFIFRFAMKFERPTDCRRLDFNGIINEEKVSVTYISPDYATQFSTKEEAKIILRQIKLNPDKFIRAI